MRVPDAVKVIAANEVAKARAQVLRHTRYLLMDVDNAKAWQALGTAPGTGCDGVASSIQRATERSQAPLLNLSVRIL